MLTGPEEPVQTGRPEQVILKGKFDPFGAGQFHAAAPVANQTEPPGIAMHLESRIVPGEFGGDLEGGVGGTVVHKNDFEVGQRLLPNAGEALAQVNGAVVDGYADRDAGRGAIRTGREFVFGWIHLDSA